MTRQKDPRVRRLEEEVRGFCTDFQIGPGDLASDGILGEGLADPKNGKLQRYLVDYWRRGTLKETMHLIEIQLVCQSRISHERIANTLGVTRSTVTHWFRDLTITAAELMALKVAYRRELSDLKQTDPDEDAMNGYALAISSLRRDAIALANGKAPSEQEAETRLFTREQFSYLYHIHASEKWQRGQQHNDSQLLQKTLTEICQNVRTVFPNCPTAQIRTLEWAEHLLVKWGRAYRVTMRALPEGLRIASEESEVELP